MENNIVPLQIGFLPAEVKFNIIKFLDDRSKRNLRLTNTEWFEIIKYRAFNFYYTTNAQYDQIIQRLKRYNFPIQISFTHHKLSLERKHFEELSKLTQITAITTNQNILTSSDSDFEPLTSFSNLEIVPYFLPDKFLTALNNLTHLDIYSNKATSLISLKSFSRLVSLSWILDREFVKPTQVTDPLCDIQNPQLLTALTVQNGRKLWIEKNFERFSSLKELKFLDYQRDENHLEIFPELPNLESLLLRVQEFFPLTSLTNLTQLDLKLYSSTQKNISTLAALTQLKILYLQIITRLGIEDFQFMTALTNLECFGFTFFQQQNPEECLIFPYINAPNLTKLASYPDINLNHVTHLSKIINLKVIMASNSHQLLKFSQLTALDAEIRSIDDLNIIEQITSLKSLNLNSQKWPKTKFQVSKLVNLEELSCAGLYQKTLCFEEKSLQNLPLKQLNITMKISDKFLKSISNITTLEELILHEASISDKKLSKLENLSLLTHLEVVFSKKVSGVILTTLTSLQYLVIRHNSSINVNEDMLMMKLPRLWHCEVIPNKNFID